MITQKPISLKIDTELLEQLDAEVALGWRKRNYIINRAIRLYLSLQDCRRIVKCIANDESKSAEVHEWLKKNFPEALFW